MNQDLQKELFELAEKYCPEKDGEHGEDCLYHELVPLMEKVRKEAYQEAIEIVQEIENDSANRPFGFSRAEALDELQALKTKTEK